MRLFPNIVDDADDRVEALNARTLAGSSAVDEAGPWRGRAPQEP